MTTQKARSYDEYRYFSVERAPGIDSTDAECRDIEGTDDIGRAQDVVVARIVDSQLVGSISEFLRLEFRQLLTSPDFGTLVIDFEKVKMISSSSIQSLLDARDRCLNANIDLRLASMNSSVRYVFETLNLVGTVFRVFDSTAEAVSEQDAHPTFYDQHGRYCPRYEDEDAR